MTKSLIFTILLILVYPNDWFKQARKKVEENSADKEDLDLKKE